MNSHSPIYFIFPLFRKTFCVYKFLDFLSAVCRKSVGPKSRNVLCFVVRFWSISVHHSEAREKKLCVKIMIRCLHIHKAGLYPTIRIYKFEFTFQHAFPYSHLILQEERVFTYIFHISLKRTFHGAQHPSWSDLIKVLHFPSSYMNFINPHHVHVNLVR